MIRALGLLIRLPGAGCAPPFVAMNRRLGTDARGRRDCAPRGGLAPSVAAGAGGHSASADAAGSEILFFVTLAGGGQRSAAFGHGALRGLGAIPLAPRRPARAGTAAARRR
jgi:hypothetical protein